MVYIGPALLDPWFLRTENMPERKKVKRRNPNLDRSRSISVSPHSKPESLEKLRQPGSKVDIIALGNLDRKIFLH